MRKKMFLIFQTLKSKSCLSTLKHLRRKYKAWKDRKKIIDTISYNCLGIGVSHCKKSKHYESLLRVVPIGVFP